MILSFVANFQITNDYLERGIYALAISGAAFLTNYLVRFIQTRWIDDNPNPEFVRERTRRKARLLVLQTYLAGAKPGLLLKLQFNFRRKCERSILTGVVTLRGDAKSCLSLLTPSVYSTIMLTGDCVYQSCGAMIEQERTLIENLAKILPSDADEIRSDLINDSELLAETIRRTYECIMVKSHELSNDELQKATNANGDGMEDIFRNCMKRIDRRIKGLGMKVLNVQEGISQELTQLSNNIIPANTTESSPITQNKEVTSPLLIVVVVGIIVVAFLQVLILERICLG